MGEKHTLILDEAGDADPKTWEWLKKAMEDGRVAQTIFPARDPLNKSTADRLIREFRAKLPRE